MDLKENSSFHWSNLCPTLFSLQKLSNDSNSSRLWYQSITRKFQFWLWSNVYINKKTPRSPMNFSTQLRPDLYVKNIYNRLSHLTTNRKRRDKGKKKPTKRKRTLYSSLPLSLPLSAAREGASHWASELVCGFSSLFSFFGWSFGCMGVLGSCSSTFAEEVGVWALGCWDCV